MLETSFLATAFLLFIVIVLQLALLKRKLTIDTTALNFHFSTLEKNQERLERALRDDLAKHREEAASHSRRAREEQGQALSTYENSVRAQMAEIANLQKNQLDSFAKQLAMVTQAQEQKLEGMRETIEQRLLSIQSENTRQSALSRENSAANAKAFREENSNTLKGFNDSLVKNMAEIANLQKDQLSKLTLAIEQKLEALRGTVDERLKHIQDDNTKQLEQMRATVDEKLQGTLEKRLGESFRQVSEGLEQVHRGLGEMQTLATGVGDLKRVLVNVKTRGNWGEIQLEKLLEQVLSPEQYARNVKTNVATNEAVEFAIRLPGGEGDRHETVWLPIDAKFPTEDYQRLTEAQERADPEAAENAAKALANRIKSCAKDIRDKYLAPPQTTDFGIMFLPIEGLYAEVVRRTELIEVLQRDFRVVIAGPTILAALLNSLQMGFRTLAIQKRSSEVWKLLSAVKAEFGKFGETLDGVKKKLEQASNTMDEAAKRSRVIARKLRDVEELPAHENQMLLAVNDNFDDDAEEQSSNPSSGN